MSSGLKNFGIFAALAAFLTCATGGIFAITGDIRAAYGCGIIGFGIFAGANLLIAALRSGHTASAAAATPQKSRQTPAKKPAPARKTPAKASKTTKQEAPKESPKIVPDKNGAIVLYVGNLPYEAAENEVRTAFEAFGTVSTVRVVKERSTGRSKGFAFVEMPNVPEAQSALDGMNAREFSGKKLKVSQAKAKTKNPRPRTRTNNNNNKPADTKPADTDTAKDTDADSSANPYSRNSNSRKSDDDKREAEMVDWDA